MFATRESRQVSVSEEVFRPNLTTAPGTVVFLLLLLVACATPATTNGRRPETVRSHVYALPLENVLTQTTTLLEYKGLKVKRVGNALLTNWLGTRETAVITYRVYGEAIDAGLCSIRVERVVATGSNIPWTPRISQTELATLCVLGASARCNYPHSPADFEEDSPNASAPGTGPPAGTVVIRRERDAALELEFQQQIDPPIVASAETPKEVPAALTSEALADAGVSAFPRPTIPLPVGDSDKASSAGALPLGLRALTALAGIWEGTFHFRGNMVGVYAGEVTVAVRDGSAEVSDFCPESGGTLTATGSAALAAWQGELVCPPIAVKGCSSAAIRYSFANAMLEDKTLTITAAGSVDAPAGCGDTSGALSVTFVAEKADYAFISVSRTKQRTKCVWPSDWEDLASTGSMAMPEPPMDEAAYLGVIRTRGSRLTDVERLLRHCHQLVVLNGQPVLMRLAVKRAHREASR